MSGAHAVILEHLSSSILSLPPSSPDKRVQKSSFFSLAHTSEEQIESKRQSERKRGVKDDSRSPPFTLLIAYIIPVQTEVSEETNGLELRLSLSLSLSLVLLHTDFLFLICFIIHSDDITGLWNILDTQNMCHGDILNLRHCWTGVLFNRVNPVIVELYE